MTCIFYVRVHLTSKSKMAPFDLYRKYRKVEELDLFCMYVDENLYEGFFGPVSGKVTFDFHSGVHLTFKSKMAAFDL